jgi:hypothetical protein
LSLPASLALWQTSVTHHAAVAAGLAPWRPATDAWLAQAMGAQS